jgi:hypothetical protein
VNALGFGVLSKSFFRFNRRTWNVENAFYQYIGTEPSVWSQWFTQPSAAGPIVLAFNAGNRGRWVESRPPATNNPATVTGAVVSGRYAAGQLMHRLSG